MGANYLIRRTSVYYLRRRLPPALAAAVGRTHVCRSLRTSNPAIARQRARAIAVRLDEAFEKLGSKMSLRKPTKPDLDRILLHIFTELLETREFERAQRPWDYDPWSEWTDDLPDPDGPHFTEDQDVTDELRHWRSGLRSNRYEMVEDQVNGLLEAAGLEKPEPHSHYLLLLREALASVVAALEIDTDRNQGIYRPAIFPLSHGSFSSVTTGAGGGHLGAGGVNSTIVGLKISAAFDEFIRAKQASWRLDTARQARTALRMFIDIVGDMDCAQVYREDAIRFRDELAKLPALFGKGIYADLGPRDAISRRGEIAKTANGSREPLKFGRKTIGAPDIPRLTATLTLKTINKHVDFMMGLYGWLQSERQMPIGNPFSGLLYARKAIERQRTETASNRLAWEPEHIRTLLLSPVWTGAQSANRLSTPGPVIIEDERYWIPLLALFTGMRLEEIAQLEIGDIKLVDGYWIVDVRAGLDKRLKTESSERRIPLHPELLKIGLLEYRAAAQAASASKLFPKLDRTGPAQRYGAEFTKWFGRYRRAIGIIDEQRDFHGLRATFDTFLERLAGANTTLVRKLMGHADRGIAAEGYFKGFTVKDWMEVIESLDYGVDLSALYRDAELPKRVTRQFDFTPNPWARKAKEKRQAAE